VNEKKTERGREKRIIELEEEKIYIEENEREEN
jgi:hypothetical protein